MFVCVCVCVLMAVTQAFPWDTASVGPEVTGRRKGDRERSVDGGLSLIKNPQKSRRGVVAKGRKK